MYVYIDSNQFIADFLLQGAPFRYLLHFLSNSGHTLLLSDLVIEEVENKYSAELRRAGADLAKVGQRLNQLGVTSFSLTDNISSLKPYSLKALLSSHVDNIEIVGYKDVPHTEVVRRALSRKKPFDAEGDVGYRDCLLWLSLVRFLSAQASDDLEEIIFISNNWRDFYHTAAIKQSKNLHDNKTKVVDSPSDTARGASISANNSLVQFHSDLLHDLKVLKNSITPFESVVTFVDSTIDKKEHVINYEKKYELFEEFLEESGLDVLRKLDIENGATVLDWIFSDAVANSLTILRSTADLFEGVEDLDIYIAEEVGREIYVNCGYDLRIVNVALIIPRIQFEAHRPEVEKSIHVWQTTVLEDDTVQVDISLRCYYQASFSFDPQSSDCEGFSLQAFNVR